MDAQETARRVGRAFGGVDQVLKFRAAPPEPTDGDPDAAAATPDEVAIAVTDGAPAPGFASYSTVDLARFPTNVTAADGTEIRTEIATAGRVGVRAMSDVLAQCAFAIAGGSFHVTPNCLVPNAVHEAAPGHAMRHVMLVAPFLWPDLELYVEEDDAITTWLQAVPISDPELAFASESGANELFRRLEAAAADVSDLDRADVV